MLESSNAWRGAYPGAQIGILALDSVANPEVCPELDLRKTALENRLRSQFAGQTRQAIEALPTIQSYTTYLKPFKKTYHVLLQLESVTLKNKPIPAVAALVEAMFMAELESQLLTAGHDLNTLQLPVSIEVAKGDERYILRSGQEQVLKSNDMFIKDRKGIISDIIYGPDQRTQITQETRRVLFTVYAPAGISRNSLFTHLETMREYVKLISPKAETTVFEVVEAGS
ncbi:MAG: phenylalanine--tRNA ligase beta subunit-related protein [Anaerolineaceae bacterium]|jgi:DNA/RNA-binding domain of Phe-tRNA-synthetase-like protein